MPKWGRLLLLATLALSGVAHAALTCTVTSTAVPVRSEGLTERMGDVALICTGGTPGDHISGTMMFFLSSPITNRVQGDGTLDMPLTITNGDLSTVGVRYPTPLSIGVLFQNIDFTLVGTSATLKIANIRGSVAQDLESTRPVMASVGFNGAGLTASGQAVSVGLPSRGFAASVNSVRVRCTGSPAPETVSMSALFAVGTASQTVRVTDRFHGALEKRQASADSGVRVILSYTGLPAGARVFVPNLIAGSDATVPTGGGDLILPRAAGVYTPTVDGSLLLARVNGADANGAGGAPVYTPGAPGSGIVILDAATELTIVNGAAQAVFEVVDDNPAMLETVEIPSFFAFANTGGAIPPPATVSMVIGPVSSVAKSTETDPIPRFVNAAPPLDCALLDDCASFPSMRITAPTLEFTAVANGADQTQWVFITNDAGGALVWTASVAYTRGTSGWLDVNARNQELGALLTISPHGLTPGLYEATLTVDGGQYGGVRTLPVKFTVNAPGARIESIGHAATYAAGPVVPGSLAMLKGQGLNGQNVSVTFDGLGAQLLYKSATQLNVVAPAELGVRASAQVIVTVDGAPSQPYTAPLAASNPGVFSNGVTNLDGSQNSTTHPADPGGYLIVYATGLPATGVTARLGSQEIPAPDYAGPAPTLAGVQQVNLRIPAGLASVTVDLVLCGGGACSPAVKATVR